jgi:hypothetical protein
MITTKVTMFHGGEARRPSPGNHPARFTGTEVDVEP